MAGAGEPSDNLPQAPTPRIELRVARVLYRYGARFRPLDTNTDDRQGPHYDQFQVATKVRCI